jgi:hypothetical protein
MLHILGVLTLSAIKHKWLVQGVLRLERAAKAQLEKH